MRSRSGRIRVWGLGIGLVGALAPGCFDARDLAHLGDAERQGEAYVQLALGDSLLRDGQMPEALAAFDAAHELAPEELTITLRRARAYARAGHLEESDRVFAAARDTHTNRVEVYAQWGAAMLENRRPQEAAVPLRRATQLDPSDGETWQLLGMASFMTRTWGEAINAFSHAERLRTPSEPRVLFAWASALAKTGDLIEARKRLEQVLAATEPDDPLHAAARRSLAALGTAPPIADR